ncbi:MAG: aminotransferase class V-fold PLP-dependent enzyme [Brevinema sp.]
MKDYTQDILQIRKDFPIFQQKNNHNISYLDNAATTFKPHSVIKALNEYYTEYSANIHRAVYDMSQKASDAYESSREITAKFLGASFEEIVFTSGTTAGINLFSRSFAESFLQKGDRIILSEMEHHANLIPWQKIAKDFSCTLEFIPINPQGALDLSSLDTLLQAPTKLLALTALSNTLGTINPITQITELCKKRNIYTFIDAAQSVAHQAYNLKEQDKNIDFLVFSGHKMLASTGIGILYGKKELLKKMPPFFLGGGIVYDVSLEHSIFGAIPSRFEAGTPPIAEAISLAAAIQYIQNLGWDLIHGIDLQHRVLAQEMFDSFKNYLQVFGNTPSKAPIFSFHIPGLHPHDIGSFLNEFQICIRTGHQCTQPTWKRFQVSSVTRASAYIYNTPQEWEHFTKTLKSLLEFFDVRKLS